MFTTYAIGNILKNKIYIGHTDNLKKRLQRHNKKLPNKRSSFTSKNHGKWFLIYKEEFQTRKEAMKREKELKGYQGRKFIREKFEEYKEKSNHQF